MFLYKLPINRPTQPVSMLTILIRLMQVSLHGGGEGGGSRAMQVRYHLHGEGGGEVPQVPQVQVHWNSLNVHEKYTNSAHFHEKRTLSKRGRHFSEFCENDARFPWVELVYFLKIGGGVTGT